MLKFKLLLKGSQFYHHSNTLSDTFVLCLPQYSVLIGGRGEGGGGRGADWKCWKQTTITNMLQLVASKGKPVYLYLLHSTTLKIHRTLNPSYLHICRYRSSPIPISQGMCRWSGVMEWSLEDSKLECSLRFFCRCIL